MNVLPIPDQQIFERFLPPKIFPINQRTVPYLSTMAATSTSAPKRFFANTVETGTTEKPSSIRSLTPVNFDGWPDDESDKLNDPIAKRLKITIRHQNNNHKGYSWVSGQPWNRKEQNEFDRRLNIKEEILPKSGIIQGVRVTRNSQIGHTGLNIEKTKKDRKKKETNKRGPYNLLEITEISSSKERTKEEVEVLAKSVKKNTHSSFSCPLNCKSNNKTCFGFETKSQLKAHMLFCPIQCKECPSKHHKTIADLRQHYKKYHM